MVWPIGFYRVRWCGPFGFTGSVGVARLDSTVSANGVALLDNTGSDGEARSDSTGSVGVAHLDSTGSVGVARLDSTGSDGVAHLDSAESVGVTRLDCTEPDGSPPCKPFGFIPVFKQCKLVVLVFKNIRANQVFVPGAEYRHLQVPNACAERGL
ncbi:unnamed protein product, partial [Nesidiocoris tenuis]